MNNTDVVTPSDLLHSYEFMRGVLHAMESNATYRTTTVGEPQLGRRGFYSTISHKKSVSPGKVIMDLMTYADGSNGLIAISDIVGIPVAEPHEAAQVLLQHGLLEEIRPN